MRMAMTRANKAVASNEEGYFASRLRQHMLLPGFWGMPIDDEDLFFEVKSALKTIKLKWSDIKDPVELEHLKGSVSLFINSDKNARRDRKKDFWRQMEKHSAGTRPRLLGIWYGW